MTRRALIMARYYNSIVPLQSRARVLSGDFSCLLSNRKERKGRSESKREIECGVRENCGRKEECGVLREEGGLMLMKVGFCEVWGREWESEVADGWGVMIGWNVRESKMSNELELE
jgi:hypothetical protein